MSYMFYDCSHLKEIDLTNFITNKVTNMAYMFSGCHNLKKIDLSNFNTEKVDNMEHAFYGCNNLNYLDISNFRTNKTILDLFDSNLNFFGTIKGNSDFINKIKDQIPSDWEIIVINKN